MTLILHVVCILLVVISRATEALPLDNYHDLNANNPPQFAAYQLQLYNHNNNNNNDPFSHQSQTRYYPSRSISTMANFQNRYNEPLFERTLTPSYNSPWSGPPIVVDYEDDYSDREQPMQPNSGRLGTQSAHLPPRSQICGPPQLLLAQSDSRSAFKTFPAPAPYEQQPQQLHYHQHQQQYSPPERDFYKTHSHNSQWPSTTVRRDHARQFASHFEHYVHKYPRRLQPIYELSAVYNQHNNNFR